ncbi:ABC transporter ATP-binding protein [Thermoplasma sp.]|uniref:ABC transporter ATP-binding protein n=1 Tax=Thermoplasma sp. TaxID=1973142 RepID=UPI00260E4DC3|nr:ATP-binding cassette domain-containing protein [Thermoplasma sp.]
MEEIAISAEGINKTYLDRTSMMRWKRRDIIKNFSYDFISGVIYGIIGASGSGKTTLANILSGFDKPDSGSLLYFGKPAGHSNKKIRNIFQDTFKFLNPLNSINWYIESVSKIISDRRIMEELLYTVGLDPKKFGTMEVEKLSGGQRQRLAFAMVVSQNPDILILDEPFSMIDPPNSMVLFSVLKKYLKGSTVIYIDHNLDRVAYLCDHVIAFDHGNIIEDGDTYSIFRKPKTEYVRKLMDASRSISSRLNI